MMNSRLGAWDKQGERFMDANHKHGPIRNLREFVKEVGIIVVGVLIALGGEQAVQAVNHHYQVQEARAALKDELGWNLASFKLTKDLSHCVLARLDEVDRWAKSWDSGRPIRLSGPIQPPRWLILRSSAWRVTSGEAVARMPLQERATYAGLYDLFDFLELQREKDRDAWNNLALYQPARQLSEEQRLHVAADIRTVREGYNRLISNIQIALTLATRLHVEPGQIQGQSLELTKEFKANACKPLLEN